MHKSLFLLLASVGILGYVVLLNQKPHDTVSEEGKFLSPCPTTPNCCCSIPALTQDSQQLTASFPLSGLQSLNKLVKVLKQMGGYQILQHRPTYLHAVASTPFFGFCDDLEFLLQDNKIEVRSISRLGYYDFGTNKKRLEEIKKLYEIEIKKNISH